MIPILQLLIATLLIFIFAFGLGFIVNMLVKTTWFPLYGYVILLICLFIFKGNVYFEGGYFLTAIGGFIGAILSGTTIRSLRNKGYRMF